LSAVLPETMTDYENIERVAWQIFLSSVFLLWRTLLYIFPYCWISFRFTDFQTFVFHEMCCKSCRN